MPGGDRTGPLGLGSRTGRAAGFCSGSDNPGYMNSRPGMGLNRGRGRGWRNWFNATGLPGWARARGESSPYSRSDFSAQIDAESNITPEGRLNILKAQALHYQEVLKDLQKSIDQLEERKAKT